MVKKLTRLQKINDALLLSKTDHGLVRLAAWIGDKDACKLRPNEPLNPWENTHFLHHILTEATRKISVPFARFCAESVFDIVKDAFQSRMTPIDWESKQCISMVDDAIHIATETYAPWTEVFNTVLQVEIVAKTARQEALRTKTNSKKFNAAALAAFSAAQAAQAGFDQHRFYEENPDTDMPNFNRAVCLESIRQSHKKSAEFAVNAAKSGYSASDMIGGTKAKERMISKQKKWLADRLLGLN